MKNASYTSSLDPLLACKINENIVANQNEIFNITISVLNSKTLLPVEIDNLKVIL